MALSPNYGWTEPDNSGLVKNGAQDMRTLGDAIDTSVWNVGYGQAGKNKIINGDFSVNQRNFSSTTTNAEYNFDRWRTIYTGGTSTTSAQVFTPGTAPVAGYEGKNYYRVVITGQSATTDSVRMQEQVESVRTFAGQTTTYSFWAKASAGTPKVAVISLQAFGFGGSPSAAVTTEHGTVTLSTSWARYSITCIIPSISGKTLGTNGDDSISVRLLMSAGSAVSGNQSIGVQNYTFETWGHQWEAGSVATPFQTATGTIQGELSAAQRYYYRISATNSPLSICEMRTTTTAGIVVPMAVTMRTSPTLDASSGTNYFIAKVANTNHNISGAWTLDIASPTASELFATTGTTATAGNAGFVYLNNASAYLGFSAEL
jgi:hypothetical protein